MSKTLYLKSFFMSLNSITYPLTLDNNGSLSYSSDSNTVKEQIISVLETQPSERVMQPLYGMRDRILSALSPSVVVSDIENIIQQHVPLAKSVKVTYENNPMLFEEGILNVVVSFEYDNTTTSFALSLSDS